MDAEDEPVRLDAGSVILFPHGNAHTLSTRPGLRAPPRCIHIADAYTSDNGWLKSLIDAIVRESNENRVGGGSILSKLSELIFIEVIRRYVESRRPMQTGWFEALADPLAGEAIRRQVDPSRG